MWSVKIKTEIKDKYATYMETFLEIYIWEFM